MHKKFLFSILSVLMIFCLTACGNENSSTSTEKTAVVTEKPKDSAEKSVLGWAEMCAFGVSDNVSATGMTKAQEDQISERVIGDMLQAFSAFPLNESNVQRITTEYITKLQAAMEISTKIKKADDEHPIVEVSADVIDQKATAEMAAKNENMIALGQVLGELRAKGVTDEDIKNDAEFQEAVFECVNAYVDEIILKEKQTLDVTCNLAEGDDGKIYWMPADVEKLQKFLGGVE